MDWGEWVEAKQFIDNFWWGLFVAIMTPTKDSNVPGYYFAISSLKLMKVSTNCLILFLIYIRLLSNCINVYLYMSILLQNIVI